MKFDPNLSDVTFLAFSTEKLQSFLRWEGAFRKLSEESPLLDQYSRRVIKEGWQFVDVYWALHHIGESFEAEADGRRRFREFRRRLRTVLNQIDELRGELQALLETDDNASVVQLLIKLSHASFSPRELF